MIDFTTDWVGLQLPTPIVVGASPLTNDVEALRSCVANGAGAVVMHSLFEEQIVAEQLAVHRFIDSQIDMDAEAQSFLPESQVFSIGSAPYVASLRKLRQTLSVPIIASLNGTSPGGWCELASDLANAGATGIELNLYDIATSFLESGADLESRQLSVVRSVVKAAEIPVIVKLSPFYSSLPGFVRGIESAGAKAVVLFNRFYQPDINLEDLGVSKELRYSTNAELPLRLHGIALLSGRTPLHLGLTGGVHSGDDAAKAILCGAHTVQLASALLAHGPDQLKKILNELRTRLEGIGYRTLAEACGVLSLKKAPDPHAWERLNYARLLKSWQPQPENLNRFL